MEKLIQIYEDDPNVNCDVLKKHFQHQEEGEISSVIELGSFGLQIVHGTLQTGMTRPGWNLYIVLNDMRHVFDKSPVRTDIYIRETCDVFPFHFGRASWVEDGPAPS